MKFSTSFALLAATLAVSVSAGSNLAPAGTIPTYLVLQQAYYDGTATPAQVDQMTSLGKKLAAEGVRMDKMVGTGPKGQQVWNLLGLPLAQLLQVNPSEVAARAVHATHEKPVDVNAPQEQGIGFVPTLIKAVEAAGLKDATPADQARALELSKKALAEENMSPLQLTRIVGTDGFGKTLLGQLNIANQVPTGKRDVLKQIEVAVASLLDAPAANTAIPTGTVPRFQYRMAQLWSTAAKPDAEFDPVAMADFVQLGQQLQKANPKSLKSIMGTSQPATVLMSLINGHSAAIKRGMQQHKHKRGSVFHSVDAQI